MPYTVIGRSVPRVDGAEKAVGLTRYAADVQLPGLVHARLVLSPHAHARVLGIDAAAAKALPGVLGVFGARDLPVAAPDPSDRNRSPLALDEVVFNGQPVVAVVAETGALAEDAAALVRVDYDELPAAVDPVAAMQPWAPIVRDNARDEKDEAALGMHGAEAGSTATDEPTAPNVASTARFSRGDIARGFAEAEVIIERRYRTAMVHQGYLEPQAAIASADRLGTVTVWTSTQAMFYARTEVAATLGVPESRVKVIAMPIGGGFGGKYVLLEPLVAALAMALRRPVSLVLERREEFLATTPAPASIFEVKTGARRDGTLTALQARVIFDAGAYSGAPLDIACATLGSYYRVPHLDIRGSEVLTHKPGCGAYRAPGAVQATFAIESQIDALAAELRIDPLELRLRNAANEGDPLPSGRPWPKMGLRACLERLRELRSERRGRPADGRQRGVGLAVGGWAGGVEPASAVCRLNGDGSLHVVVGSVDLSGTNTGLALIAAEASGIALERIRVINGDTDAAPYAGASGGSKITYTVGAAVERAARDARRQILAIAANRLEAAVEDLEVVDGSVGVRGVPDRRVGLEEIATLSMSFGGKYEPVFGRGASATVARAPGFAAHLVDVAVDGETGRVEILEHVVVQDVGRALNPAEVVGQIHGGAVQGAGWALLERMAYDESGRLLSATLMDYALPQIGQAGPIRVELLELPSEAGPFGAKGVGEPPVVGAAAAIANAVAAATGHRFTELPISSAAICAASP